MQDKTFERLIQYFRCPEQYAQFAVAGPLSDSAGYFRFGEDAVCFGKYREPGLREFSRGQLPDALCGAAMGGGTLQVPFDPSEVAENLLLELYVEDWRKGRGISFLAELYYLFRPFLPSALRRVFQRIHFAGWEKIPFPRWPVDFSVDNLYSEILLALLKSSTITRIPFIWFWPDGASACSLMTHDVETRAGSLFCHALMDIDDSFHIKSSFQIVPEERYKAGSELLSAIRERGFEVCVHDLNHDGHLFRNRELFLRRATRINAYGREFHASGFRAGVLYRKQLWFDALDFSYDMSVPNVAHLDPQRGGCCTVMPYFIGDILELPVTATQDYTLFHILRDYSNSVWKRQIDLIAERHGLISFIVHPDYVMKGREQEAYLALLAELDRLRSARGLWITIPAELNAWWRQRARMRLINEDGQWRIEGDDKARAQIAFASLGDDGKLRIEFTAKADQSPRRTR